DQLADALPVPTWAPFVARLLALIGMVALLQLVVMVSGICIQTLKGYFHYQLDLYVKELFGLTLLRYALLCVLAMAVQAIANEKYLGHFIMVLYYLLNAFASRFGFEHHLYRFGTTPSRLYSDMNGFGHFLRGVLWFDAYWVAFALALAGLSTAFTVRGV